MENSKNDNDVSNQDKIDLKLELVKFVNSMMQHNCAMSWETHKQWPEKITAEDVIAEADKLYRFITK